MIKSVTLGKMNYFKCAIYWQWSAIFKSNFTDCMHNHHDYLSTEKNTKNKTLGILASILKLFQ